MATSQRRSSALELITQVMRSMSMTVPTTIAGSTDKRTVQFWQLATDAGQQLVQDEHKWQVLSAEMTITTDVGVSEYPLPGDFAGFFADAEWNRTNRLPALGSLQQFEWQALKARDLGGTTITTIFRIQDDKVVFYDSPSSVQTIVLPYVSRGWCTSHDGAERRDNLVEDTDIVLFDPQLFKDKLKLLWYEAKGFDTGKAERNFMRTLMRCRGADVPGRVLTVGRAGGYPYLGVLNIPETGYGQ